MNKYLLLFLFLFINIFININFSQAQTSEIDSLQKVLANHVTEDTTKVNLLLEISRLYGSYDKKNLLIAQKALKTAQKIYFQRGQVEAFLEMANYYYYKSAYEKAFELAEKALKIAEEIADKNLITICLNLIGIVYDLQGDYTKALICYQKSLRINEAIKSQTGIAADLLNIGAIYILQEDMLKALDYFNQSLEIAEKIADTARIITATENIAEVYLDRKDYAKVLEYAQNSLKLAKKINNREGIAYSEASIGTVFYQKGNYDKSLQHTKRALNLSQEVGNQYAVCSYMILLSEILLAKKEYKKALKYAKNSLEIANELDILGEKKDSHELLANIYEKTHSYKEAYQHYKKYKALNDSVFSEKNTRELTTLEVEYKNDKEKQRLTLAQAKKDAIQKAEVKEQEKVRNLLILGIILTCLLVFAAVYGFLQKRKANTILAKQKQGIEKDKKIIEKQAEKLIELNKTKTRFFANVSHELRTPITLIKAPLQSLIKNQSNEKKKFLLNTAAQNTDKLLSLVNEILDLTKLEHQKLKLEEENVLFYPFIKQILSNFQSVAKMQEIEMILKYQTQKGLKILLDKNKFQKILNNLLSNALKFTLSKGKIVINVQDLEEKILIQVQDNGKGILEEDIPHVFERYFQSSQNSHTQGGLGIGLALTKELLKLFEGKIWLESSTKKGSQGTSFFVEFPKKEVLSMLTTKDVLTIEKDFSMQKNSKTGRKLKQDDFLNKKGRKTILVVDDNQDLSDYLVFILSGEYTILTAENGQKGLELLSKGQIPNLIISDLMMPVMDGYEFLEAVKNNENWTGIPFIMLTARVAMQDKLKALRVGVDDYITKPFEEDELLVRVENLLANYQERVNFIQSEQKNTATLEKETQKVVKLSISSKDKKWLAAFETLIVENLTHSLFSIDYLSELLKIGRSSLYTKVKTLTGLSPNQYVQAIRLKVAKDILENKNYKSITEVANRVGFKNTAHFSNLFKKEYGKSPSNYL